MNAPKTRSLSYDIRPGEICTEPELVKESKPDGIHVDAVWARWFEDELRNALTWLETYHRSFGEPATGPLAQDIARIKELLK